MLKRGEKLHEGQVRLARALFTEEKRVVQAQWGRSGGKTLAACYIAWCFALLNDNAQVLIVCPQRKQGKDIYWAPGRIQHFGPQEYVEQHKESELRTIFKNGSVITIDGCENYEALRGIKPHLVIYDEFQHHSKEFHLEVMSPNLTAKRASLVVLGTPPRNDCYYVEFRTQLLTEIKEGDSTRAYFEFPSEINPSLDRQELTKVKERLVRSGDEKIWLREYMAQLIYGGEGAVFSTWNRERHTRKHHILITAIEYDKSKLQWYTVFEPGNMTCFAVLFIAFNPYTSQIFFLDEIYETNPRHTDAVSIWDRAMLKEQELYPGAPENTFRRLYDSAASWFFINVKKWHMDAKMTPTKKNTVKGYSAREAGCSLMKQIMGMDNCIYVSDRCEKYVWEVENYVLDENGNYPDIHDHLLNAAEYFLAASNYKFIERCPPDVIRGVQIINTEFGKKEAIRVEDPADWSDNVMEEDYYVDVAKEYCP
jgi:hypothetical protein